MPKRPVKLSLDRIDKICQMIRRGAWLDTAAVAAGVSKVTLHEWLKNANRNKDRHDFELSEYEKLCRTFAEDVDKAAADSEIRDLDRIDKAADKVWQAAAWRLERRFPSRWRRADTIINNAAIAQTGVEPSVKLILPANGREAPEAIKKLGIRDETPHKNGNGSGSVFDPKPDFPGLPPVDDGNGNKE